jgi:hypothetical protein
VFSFTDNRQDASLQAGHLNDFVQVALLRSALVTALDEMPFLTFDILGERVFQALHLRPEDIMKEADSGPGYMKAKDALVDLLQYRCFEDLKRAWHVAQPNLEQCGRLASRYRLQHQAAALELGLLPARRGRGRIR